MLKRSKFIIFIFIMLMFALIVPSCSKAKEKIERMKPEIRGVTLQWGTVTPQTTEVFGTVKVYNPNSIALPVKRASCTVYLDGINMGSVETTGLQIEKLSESPVNLIAKIDNSKIPLFWVEHIKRNEKSEATVEISITFDLEITDFTFPFKTTRPIETDLLSSLTKVQPVSVEKKAKIPFLGEKTIFRGSVESVSGSWGTVTPQTTQVNLVAKINNQNPYPLVIPNIEFNADMNGITLGSGKTDIQFACSPNSEGEIQAIVALDTGKLGQWFVSHIQNGEKSTFNMSAGIYIDPPGFDKFSYTVWEGNESFQTDILGKVK